MIKFLSVACIAHHATCRLLVVVSSTINLVYNIISFINQAGLMAFTNLFFLMSSLSARLTNFLFFISCMEFMVFKTFFLNFLIVLIRKIKTSKDTRITEDNKPTNNTR